MLVRRLAAPAHTALDSTKVHAQSDPMGRTMSWRTEGRLNVVYHGLLAPTNLEWQRYVTEAVVTSSARNGTRVLVLSRGGSPDGHQRQTLAAALRGRPSPVALLTDKVLVRAAISAMSLFNPSMKAFATTALNEAGNYLGLTLEERERAARLLVELEMEVDGMTSTSEPRGRPQSR
jgi:hypothetical protein